MMDVGATLVADGEAAEAVQPREGALDNPPVLSQPLAAFHATAPDARLDPALVAGTAAAGVIVAFVGVQLARASARSAPFARHGRDRVEQVLERHAVVRVGPGQREGKRDAAPVGGEVALGSCLAAIRRVRARGRPPLFAGTDALSMQARFQSIRSAACSLRSNSRCKRSHTPASCQSRSLRQQVTPEPQPISDGNISHAMPERRTKRMPVSAARFGTTGRPPFGFGGPGGSNGSTINQSSSDTSGVAMPLRLGWAYSGSRL